MEAVPQEPEGTRRHARSDVQHLFRWTRSRAQDVAAMAPEVHAAVALRVLPAEPDESWFILVLLDDRGRGRVQELLSRVDAVRERVQEHGWEGHDGLGRGLHLQYSGLRDDRGDGNPAGSGLSPARGDPQRDDVRRADARATHGEGPGDWGCQAG